MAVKAKKKLTAKSKTKKKITAKKKTLTTARKKTSTAKIKKGDRYQCGVCGIAVSIDEACGCVDVCDIICCGKQMKPKKK